MCSAHDENHRQYTQILVVAAAQVLTAWVLADSDSASVLASSMACYVLLLLHTIMVLLSSNVVSWVPPTIC
jgi:hypothetical protein